MRTKQTKTTVVVILLTLAGLLVFSLFAGAGDLEPSAPPGSTMKTLQEVYDAASSGVSEREGFVKQLTAVSDVLVVPQGQRFVVMQILTRNSSDTWELKIDGSQFLNQDIFGYRSTQITGSISLTASFNVTFPDRCVTVEQGQTLSFVQMSSSRVTIIGYLYDVP